MICRILLHPTLNTLDDGLRLDVYAVTTVAGAVMLSASVEVSHAELRLYDTRLSGSTAEPVTFQLPEVREVRGAGRFDLPSGDHAVLVPGMDPGREVVVLVRASLTTAKGR